MGKALSSELSCPCDRSCWHLFHNNHKAGQLLVTMLTSKSSCNHQQVAYKYFPYKVWVHGMDGQFYSPLNRFQQRQYNGDNEKLCVYLYFTVH